MRWQTRWKHRWPNRAVEFACNLPPRERRDTEHSDWRPAGRWVGYLGAMLVSGLCTAAASPLTPSLGLVSVVMIYLLGTTLGALFLSYGPSVTIAVLNTLAFDFLFVPPVFSFTVANFSSLITLGVMLVVALVIVALMTHIREQRASADSRERRTSVLYAMSRELAVATDMRTMTAAAVRHVCAVFDATAVVFLVDDAEGLAPMPGGEASTSVSASELEAARKAAARGERCGTNVIHIPLMENRSVAGVLVVRLAQAGELPAEQSNLLDAFAAQLALALQRARLAKAAEAAKISAERILLRNTLLASISHDLRTPLSAIAGAGSLLAQPEYALNADRRTTLGRLIERKALDMSQLLTNVLELAQLEFGTTELRTEWHSIDDLVELAVRTNSGRLARRLVDLKLPPDLPFIMVESTLIVKILGNLLENAAKYTPPGTTITISAAARGEDFLLVVEDDGPGLPPGDPERLFEKFHRGNAEGSVVGVGLGLAICRAAAHMHGGEIRALSRVGGGARFEISLPVETQAQISPQDV